MRRPILLCVLMLSVGIASSAQDYIRLQNGNVVLGRVTENKSMVRIVGATGDTMTFPRSQVTEVRLNEQPTTPAPPAHSTYHDFSLQESGWWFAAEAGCALSYHNDSIAGTPEISLTSGYRFSEYLRVGLGVSPRLYLHAMGEMEKHKMRIPIYLHARGNLYSDHVRMYAPYWGVSAGYTPHEGMMSAFEVGLRLGEPRNAFLLSVRYMFQGLDDPRGTLHMGSLHIGYEF